MKVRYSGLGQQLSDLVTNFEGKEARHVTTPVNANPLVTFVLLTYNQEGFIVDAIRGAIAQTYQPLEIIISDDCSSDRTLDIARELVSDLKGRHEVIIRQTSRNVGTLVSLAEVAETARGDLLVLGAGDDISKPERVESLVNLWRSTGAWGLHSKYDRINEFGETIAWNEHNSWLQSPEYRLRGYFDLGEGPVGIVHGCTSAYDKRLFQYLKIYQDDYVLSEDGALSVLLNLIGKSVAFSEQSLVKYRQHQEALTSTGRRETIDYGLAKRDEDAIERMARSQANRCRLFLRLNQQLGNAKTRSLDVVDLENDLRLHEMRTQWFKSGFIRRLKFLFSGIDHKTLTWALPRLFGMRVFLLSKVISRQLMAGPK